MSFTKIQNADLNGIGVIGLPDQPGLSTAAMQEKFEETARSVIIPKHNNLIDELEDTTAAGNIGATAPTGRTGATVQAILDDISSFENIESGGATFSADGADTFKINAGSNVTITPMTSPDKGITIDVNGGGGSTLGDMLMNDYDRDGSVKSASTGGNGIKDYVATAISGKADSSSLATVATTGDYSDLSNTPTLATVATSGDYGDLSNTPTIPTITDSYSSISTDGMSGIAVNAALQTLDGTVTGTPSAGNTLTAFSETDGKVSATFGAISITKSQVSDLGSPIYNGFKKVEVTSGGSTTDVIATSEDTFELEAGANVTLTATGKSIKIDSTGGGGGGGSYTASKGVTISGSDIEADLKGYTAGSEAAAAYGSTANRTYAVGLDVNNKLAVNIPLSLAALSGSYADLSGTPTLATVATSGSYNDLGNKPTIPSVVNTYSSSGTDAISGQGVNAALQTLDVTDTAVSGQYVSAVSETDGKITVSRAALPTVSVSHTASTPSRTVAKKQQITINSTAYDVDGSVYMESVNEAANTSYQFTNAAILTTSAIDVYTDTWGDNPSNVETPSAGTCNVTFATSKVRTVRIYIK